MTPRHVAIFEPRTEGHHPGWLRFIVEDLLAGGFKLTLAIDERAGKFEVIRDNLGDLLREAKVLNLFAEDGAIQGGSNLGALEWLLTTSNADRIFMGALDEVASSVFRKAAFGISPPKGLAQRCGGIFHRPRFLDLSCRSLNQRLKLRGYRRLISRSFFQPILFVDPFIHAQQQQEYPQAALHYLPDPCPDGFAGNKQAARSKLGLPAERFVFLFFGVGSRRKGLHVAVEAIEQLNDPTALLLCAGRQAAPPELKRRLENLKSQGKAEILDRYVSAEEEKLCFQAADTVLLPYIGHFGTSGVFSRALAAGKPVIASDEQLLGRLVREWNVGLLSPPENAQELGRRMSHAIRLDAADLGRMQAAAQRYAEAHSREVYRKTLLRSLGADPTR